MISRSAMAVLTARVRALPRGTQRPLAELAGLNESTLSRWKAGKGNPRLSELEAFAEALGVTLGYLISDTSEETPRFPPTTARERKIERLSRQARQLSAELAATLRDAEAHRTKP